MSKLDRSGTTSSLVPVVNGASLALPATSVLGVAPAINPLAAALGQASIPALPGLPGSLPVTAVYVPPIDSVGVPSECLILKNMFDPTSETEHDFDLDIKDDVQDEVSKFGTVKHIFVDKNSAGHVYLRFDTTTSAMSAQHALHGRWFAGKMITAAYMVN
ncbi:RNA-binding protein 39-like [Papaver somniferum]|nr:RNA-binding protein 39-like [Papaver somniferum]